MAHLMDNVGSYIFPVFVFFQQPISVSYSHIQVRVVENALHERFRIFQAILQLEGISLQQQGRFIFFNDLINYTLDFSFVFCGHCLFLILIKELRLALHEVINLTTAAQLYFCKRAFWPESDITSYEAASSFQGLGEVPQYFNSYNPQSLLLSFQPPPIHLESFCRKPSRYDRCQRGYHRNRLGE